MYIKREIEATIDAMLKQGKVVLVTGARQVGKTTALKHHLGGGFDYVSMDDPRERALALEDAARGLAVAGRGLHEFEILRDGENTMALTLLRCVGYMGDWGVFPTPHMQCKGVQTLEYAVVPYAAADREQAFALAHSFADDAFVTGDVDAQAGSLPSVQTLAAVDAPALVTSACKRSEDKRATVLRLYNPLCRDVDATLTLDSAVKELYASDLAEHEGEALPIADGKAKLTVPAKKIVTYRFR